MELDDKGATVIHLHSWNVLERNNELILTINPLKGKLMCIAFFSLVVAIFAFLISAYILICLPAFLPVLLFKEHKFRVSEIENLRLEIIDANFFKNDSDGVENLWFNYRHCSYCIRGISGGVTGSRLIGHLNQADQIQVKSPASPDHD